MSVPAPRTLRTKRNFKALQLPTGPTLNLAPVGSQSGFRKPPPSSLDPSSSSTSSSTSSTNSTSTVTAAAVRGRGGGGGGLPPIPSTGDTPVTSQQRSAIRATITETIAGFPRKSLDLQNEKLVHIREIGQGNGGSVSLVRHRDTDIVMAKKIVLIDAKPAVRKQIVRELQIMHECNSAYIIECYGSYLSDPNICICMEYMDRGSFDSIYKKIGPIRKEVVARVAMSVLEGLTYLYDVHRIIHRDIKPSNILCNTKGEIKLCDFGVSGELINSIANTFVGTSIYMSPERIQGAEYSVKSDIWSLGITLVELATGRFPFSEDDSNEFDLNHPFSPPYHSSFPSSTSPSSTGDRFKLPDLDENSVMLSNLSLNTTNLSGNGNGIGNGKGGGNSRTPTLRDTFPLPLPPIPISSPLTMANLGLASLQHKRLPPIPSSTSTSTSTSASPPLPPTPTPLSSSSSHMHIPTSTTTSNTSGLVGGHTRRKSNGVSLHGGHMTMSIIELMHHIVREPAPKISDTLKFGKKADDFIAACLEKEVEKRGVPRELLRYVWVEEAKRMERDERERSECARGVGVGGGGGETFDLGEWARGLGVEG